MGDPSAPRVGDLRVRFRARAEMPVSLVAERGGWGIDSHAMPDGRYFFEARTGTQSADLVGARPPRRDAWPNHAIPVLLVAFGVFLQPRAEWWALDRRAAVLAGLLAGAAAGLLPVASVLRLLMSAPWPSAGPGAS
jgi:hypothetical protein